MRFKRSACDVLHDKVTALLVRYGIIDGYQVWMGKLAGEGRFSKKQFVEAPAMFFVTERVRAHELDGDLAQREGIIRQVNHTGRSLAKLLDDFVFADFFHKQTAGTVIAIRRP